MAKRSVPLLVTEEALRLLYSTQSDLLRFEQPRSFGRTRSSGSFGLYDSQAVRYESTYLRLIGIVEAYIDTLCSNLFGQAALDQGALLRTLISEAELQASTSWPNREHAFREYHGAPLGNCNFWDKIMAATNVRNAIAHGLGRLTPRQRNQKTRDKIAKAGVAVVDDQIRLDRKALDQCLHFAVEFIKSVDQRVQERSPS